MVMSDSLTICNVTYMSTHLALITQPMVPSVVSINFGKDNIFHKPDEAILFVMMKACLHLKIIFLFRTFENTVLFIYGFKKNEQPSCTSCSFFKTMCVIYVKQH